MTDRCEPPPELIEVDGWHWLMFKQDAPCFAGWEAKKAEWWFPEDQTCCAPSDLSSNWRYLDPVTLPAEVDALRAEVERLRAAGRALLVEASCMAAQLSHFGQPGVKGDAVDRAIEGMRAALKQEPGV